MHVEVWIVYSFTAAMNVTLELDYDKEETVSGI